MTGLNARALRAAAVAASRFALAAAVVPTLWTGVASAADVVVRDNPADVSLLGCLQPSGDALPELVYPDDALLLKQDATVRVSLTFGRADAAPDVKVLVNTGGDGEFASAVFKRVRAYRLPCLKADRGPRTLTQEFYFDPRHGRKVVWNAPRVDRSAEPAIECTELVSIEVSYPHEALTVNSSGSRVERRPHSGVVLALLNVTSENEPPGVSIRYDAGSALLAATVEEALTRLRVRCNRYPVEASKEFSFIILDEAMYAFKDMSLANFVGFVEGIEKQAIRFDFATMRCPFDVQLKLFQPYLPNVVGEVGEADANRADFLDWLRDVRLNVPKAAAKHLVGASVRVSVPCGLLDLRN